MSPLAFLHHHGAGHVSAVSTSERSVRQTDTDWMRCANVIQVNVG